jgi:hypothetical protein
MTPFVRKVRKLHSTESFRKAFSAILRERSAEYSQNSSDSAISLCILVVGSGGDGGDERGFASGKSVQI